jgi:tellurite resistance protein
MLACRSVDAHLHRLLTLVGFVSPAARPGEPLKSALIEAAFLVAVADDILSPTEIELLAEAMAFVRGAPFDGAELEHALEQLNENRSRDGSDGRLQAIGSALRDRDDRARVLRFAAVVALCDQRIVPREHGTLLKLGKALGYSPEAVLGVTAEVRQATAVG